jgi:hypothetical protein
VTKAGCGDGPPVKLVPARNKSDRASKRLAEEKLRDLLVERDRNRGQLRPVSGILVWELCEKFLDSVRTFCTDYTVRDYRCELAKLVEGFPHVIDRRKSRPKKVVKVKGDPFTPGLGGLRARDLTPLAAEEFLAVEGPAWLLQDFDAHWDDPGRRERLPAAPTYFQAYTEAGGGCYLDGELWANSPVVVGLLEATCILGRRIEDVELLSVGTTTCPYHVSHARRNGGFLRWATGLADVFMQAQVEAALGQARLMVGERMLRVNAEAAPGRFSIDNASAITELKDLGDQAARRHEKEISQRFLFARAEPFTPFYAVGQPAPAEGATT